MSIIATVCRQCGAEFEPTRDAIVRGRWRVCPACQPEEPRSQCRSCGRELRGTNRQLCLACAGLAVT